MPEPINLSDTLPLETVPATALQNNGHFTHNPNMIRIRGARQHNLKNVDLELLRDRLIVFGYPIVAVSAIAHWCVGRY